MQERINYGVIHNIRLTLTLQFLWLSSVTTIRSHALRCISVHTSHRYLTPIITPDSPSACTCTGGFGPGFLFKFSLPGCEAWFHGANPLGPAQTRSALKDAACGWYVKSSPLANMSDCFTEAQLVRVCLACTLPVRARLPFRNGSHCARRTPRCDMSFCRAPESRCKYGDRKLGAHSRHVERREEHKGGSKSNGSPVFFSRLCCGEAALNGVYG